ncbi:MAG: hypothetical protein OFPII_36430 [Osedax symbiont Rs1]|nr:MAG: hypothetical protein OFPII_36430 [Osedax symbiont Rs1]
MSLFMGITGVNEHIEPVFNAVLPSAVIMQRSHGIVASDQLTPIHQPSSAANSFSEKPLNNRFASLIEMLDNSHRQQCV